MLKMGKIIKGDKMKKEKIGATPSSTPIIGQPQDAFELINKYGTYEIQPTADSDNEYPTIAQGMPKKPSHSLKHRDKSEEIPNSKW